MSLTASLSVSSLVPRPSLTPSSSFSSECTGYSTPASSIYDLEDACEECGEYLKPLAIPPIPEKVVYGKKFASIRTAKAIFDGLHPRVQAEAAKRPLKVIGILATDDSGCAMYSKQCAAVFTDMGVEFELRDMRVCRQGVDDGFEEIRSAIEGSEGVDGLLVFFPLFDQQRDDQLRSAIPLSVDIEGINPCHLAQSSLQPPTSFLDPETACSGPIYPCTALAVVHLLQGQRNIYDETFPIHEQLGGKVVTVINRSEVVGRPLAAMLANAGARVYSIDAFGTQIYERHASSTFCVSSGPHRDEVLPLSDIIISAVPGSNYTIPVALIRPGAICVNIAEFNNFGEAITEKAGYFAPRTGRLTNLALILNLLALRTRK